MKNIKLRIVYLILGSALLLFALDVYKRQGYEIGEETSLPEITAAGEGLVSHRKPNEIWLFFEVQPDTMRPPKRR